MEQPLCLDIANLTTLFRTQKGVVRAVDDLSLKVGKGELLGLVGESGCGKSVTLLSILRLIPYPGEMVSGKILFEGDDLLKKSKEEMRRIRGLRISMVFQDPMTTLNPVFKVGEQIRESLTIHGMIPPAHGKSVLSFLGGHSRKKAEYRHVIDLMKQVGISTPDSRYFDYPHQFSGGMQQRALIAIALSCHPSLILADEPTTALDVTIQAQILELLKRINQEHQTSMIFVTHNLAVANEFCHRIAVMYAGRMVEVGNIDTIIRQPLHPYTRGLLNSIPKLGDKSRRIESIPGNVPDLVDLPDGCAFKTRCQWAGDPCDELPLLKDLGGRHAVRCHLF